MNLLKIYYIAFLFLCIFTPNLQAMQDDNKTVTIRNELDPYIKDSDMLMFVQTCVEEHPKLTLLHNKNGETLLYATIFAYMSKLVKNADNLMQYLIEQKQEIERYKNFIDFLLTRNNMKVLDANNDKDETTVIDLFFDQKKYEYTGELISLDEKARKVFDALIQHSSFDPMAHNKTLKSSLARFFLKKISEETDHTKNLPALNILYTLVGNRNFCIIKLCNHETQGRAWFEDFCTQMLLQEDASAFPRLFNILQDQTTWLEDDKTKNLYLTFKVFSETKSDRENIQKVLRFAQSYKLKKLEELLILRSKQ